MKGCYFSVIVQYYLFHFENTIKRFLEILMNELIIVLMMMNRFLLMSYIVQRELEYIRISCTFSSLKVLVLQVLIYA